MMFCIFSRLHMCVRNKSWTVSPLKSAARHRVSVRVQDHVKRKLRECCSNWPLQSHWQVMSWWVTVSFPLQVLNPEPWFWQLTFGMSYFPPVLCCDAAKRQIRMFGIFSPHNHMLQILPWFNLHSAECNQIMHTHTPPPPPALITIFSFYVLIWSSTVVGVLDHSCTACNGHAHRR